MLDTLPIIPLFHDLAPEHILTLKRSFEDFHCSKDVVIFEQGDPAKYLYLVLKGEAIIRYKPYDGPPIILTRLRDGDIFGWSAVIGTSKYTSSVVSKSEMETIRIHREDLLKLVTHQPETGKILIDRLAQIVSPRWKNAHEQIQPLLRMIDRKK